MISETVTVALQVDELLNKSVTVSRLVFAPTFEQVKLFGVTVNPAIPQESQLALFTCAGTIEAVPALFSAMLIFWQIATGRTESPTVIVAAQLLVLPLLS